MTKTLIVSLMAFLIASNVQAQTYTGNQEDIDQILENIKTFSSHVVAGDYQKISECYTEDGKIFPNRRPIIEGQGPIEQYWTLPDGIRTSAHKITPVEIKIQGEEAYDYGYYEGTTLRADGTESTWKGKYVIIWRKVEGEWKIYLDIWNSMDN